MIVVDIVLEVAVAADVETEIVADVAADTETEVDIAVPEVVIAVNIEVDIAVPEVAVVVDIETEVDIVIAYYAAFLMSLEIDIVTLIAPISLCLVYQSHHRSTSSHTDICN